MTNKEIWGSDPEMQLLRMNVNVNSQVVKGNTFRIVGNKNRVLSSQVRVVTNKLSILM